MSNQEIIETGDPIQPEITAIQRYTKNCLNGIHVLEDVSVGISSIGSASAGAAWRTIQGLKNFHRQ